MVKRTVAVLGILALTLAAGTSFAFWGGWDYCGDCRPLFLPVDCPTPPIKTIVKTWAVKIEGPCPAPGPMCGPVCCNKRGPGLCEIVTAIATPFDWLFGGIDGVYGCFNGLESCDRPVWPVLWSAGLRSGRLPVIMGTPLVGVFGTWW